MQTGIPHFAHEEVLEVAGGVRLQIDQENAAGILSRYSRSEFPIEIWKGFFPPAARHGSWESRSPH